MTLGTFFSELGLSLLAGFLGTTLMTMSQLLEMKITRREASFTPAIAVSTLFRIPFEHFGARTKVALNYVAHFGYGTLLGAVAFMLSLGIHNVTLFLLLNFLIVWGQGLILVPRLTEHPPFWKWGAKWLLLDGFHHFVLSTATAVIYLTLL